MRALLVVNPKATTTNERSRDVLVRALRSEVDLTVEYTRKRGHAAALALLPSMAVVLFLGFADRPEHRHPFGNYGYLAWPLAFGVHLWLLRSHEGRDGEWLNWLHTAGFWLLAVILCWEVGWRIDRYVDGGGVWPLIAWALVPGAPYFALGSPAFVTDMRAKRT